MFKRCSLVAQALSEGQKANAARADRAIATRQPELFLFYFYCSELSGINLQRLLHGDSVVFCCSSRDFHDSEGLTRILGRSDAEVVGAPVGDGLLDRLRFEVFAEGALNEGGELGVGGEAEGVNLFQRERLGLGQELRCEQALVAKVLFETDEAVLEAERIVAREAGNKEECDCHHDEPSVHRDVMRPTANQYDDGDDEVGDQNRKQEEVKRRVEACVVAIGLRCGHSFLVAG